MLLRPRSRHGRLRRRVLATAVVLLAVGLWWTRGPILRRYEQHRTNQALSRARTFISHGNVSDALLSVRVAAQSGLFDVASLRTAAEILEDGNVTEALVLREQVLAAVPDSSEDRAAYLRTALRQGKLEAAETAFAGFRAADLATNAGRRATVLLRLAQHRTAEAEAALTAISAANGSDPAIGFELAALRLQSGDSAIRARSREQLRQFAAGPASTIRPALRELLRDAVARGNAGDARELAERLRHLPDATLDDEIRRLNVENLWPGLLANRIKAEVRQRAARTAVEAAQFANWLTLTRRPAESAMWIELLPAPIRESATVTSAYATALASAGEWRPFARQLKAGAWGPVRAETIDSAMSAFEQQRERRPDDAGDTWRRATIANAARHDDLIVLARLAALWSMERERTRTLQVLLENFPDELAAMQELSGRYFRAGDTAALRDLWAAWSKSHPEDHKVRGDWIMAALLANGSSVDVRIAEAAAALCTIEPGNPYFVRTHAYALWRQGRLDAALACIERIPLPARNAPGCALYYGAMLAAAQRNAEAVQCLVRVRNAGLLPEERELLATTRRALGLPAGSENTQS